MRYLCSEAQTPPDRDDALSLNSGNAISSKSQMEGLLQHARMEVMEAFNNGAQVQWYREYVAVVRKFQGRDALQAYFRKDDEISRHNIRSGRFIMSSKLAQPRGLRNLIPEKSIEGCCGAAGWAESRSSSKQP